MCHESYPLGATRRCLNDGHYLCSGEIKRSKRTGKLRRKRSCTSDFDYKGWQAYSLRRETLNRKKRSYEPHGCADNCFHPSECRWHPEQIADRLANHFSLGEIDSKTQSTSADARSQVDAKMRGVSEAPINHPNPLSSTPTFLPLAENASRQSLQIAEQSARAVPKSPTKKSTPARRKSVKGSSHKVYRVLTERGIRRRTHYIGKRPSPLSPVREECPSPRTPPPTHEATHRQDVTSSKDPDELLQSDDFESYFESGIWGKDHKEAIDITIGIDRSAPMDMDSKVSRPTFRFTSSFIRYLDSQDPEELSPPISPPIANEDKEELESDDQHTMLDLEEYSIWAHGMENDYSAW